MKIRIKTTHLLLKNWCNFDKFLVLVYASRSFMPMLFIRLWKKFSGCILWHVAISRKRTGKHVSVEMQFLDANHSCVLNKCVHRYEKWKFYTLGNQSIAAKVTRFHGGGFLETNSVQKFLCKHPTKVSMDTKKQQTFSMDTIRLFKRPQFIRTSEVSDQ
jgi:hypothetical protein